MKKLFDRLKRRVAPGPEPRAIAGSEPAGFEGDVGDRGAGAPTLADAEVRREEVSVVNALPAASGTFRATLNEVVHLAWPIAVAMLGDTAMGLVDTKLVAGLGATALGGVGVATTLMYLNYSIVFGLMRGVKVRTSHAVGEGRPRDGLRYAHGGVAMGVVLGVVIFALCRDVSGLLRLLSIDDATIPYARDFLAARTFGAVSTCVLSALIQYRQGVGDTRSPMIVGLLANVINAVLAYGLIYGHFGLPALGVKGAGYATAFAEAVEVSILAWLVIRESLRARKRAAKSTLSVARAAREVAILGVPTGFQFGMETLAFTAFTAILGGIGAAEIAAHQLAFAVIRVSFLPGVAIAEAASVLVGKSLGQRILAEADRVTRASILIAAGFMTACGVVFGLGGGIIARAMIDDASVSGIVTKLLYVAAVFQTVDGITIVLRGALRGAKDVRVVAVIGIACAWVCIPGAAYLLGRMAGWGAMGGWLGFLAESSIAAMLFWRRWNKGAWRSSYAPASAPTETTPTTPTTSEPVAA
jgi:MATE family multidrug resistance protein